MRFKRRGNNIFLSLKQLRETVKKSQQQKRGRVVRTCRERGQSQVRCLPQNRETGLWTLTTNLAIVDTPNVGE